MKTKLVILFLLYCTHLANSNFLDTVTSTVSDYYCNYYECCNEKTVPYNLKSLQTMLNTKLYGQHIASEVVLNAINSHVRKSKPKNPLVMSFHGANGGGKSYVSKMIAKAFYKNGENSNYFHFYYGLQDFPFSGKNQDESIAEYQKQLKYDIEAAIKSCDRSLFIFDGVDYLPPGLLDALMPFIDCPNCGNKIQRRKSIFILLSNTGSRAIENKLLEKMHNGTKRESTSLQDFEESIISEAYSEDGPFYKSKVIKSDAINFYVPFLPLEREHLEKCIREAFEDLKSMPTKDLIDEVFQELRFGPEPENLFSISGCKRVEQIVGRVNARLNPLFNDFDNDDGTSNDEL